MLAQLRLSPVQLKSALLQFPSSLVFADQSGQSEGARTQLKLDCPLNASILSRSPLPSNCRSFALVRFQSASRVEYIRHSSYVPSLIIARHSQCLPCPDAARGATARLLHTPSLRPGGRGSAIAPLRSLGFPPRAPCRTDDLSRAAWVCRGDGDQRREDPTKKKEQAWTNLLPCQNRPEIGGRG